MIQRLVHYGLLYRELPIRVAGIDNKIEDVGVLLNVPDPSTHALLVHDFLKWAAADSAVGGDSEGASRDGSVVAWLQIRFPTDAQCAGIARERFSLEASASGPRSEQMVANRTLAGLWWAIRASTTAARRESNKDRDQQ